MAQTIDTEDLGKDTLSKNTPGQPAVVSGQAGSGNIPQSQASSNPNQTKGSGYQNIQKVLQANAGNKLGQTIGSNIQSAGNTAQDNLRQAQGQFQQQTQQNQVNTGGNQQLVGNVLQNAAQYAGDDQNDPNVQAGKRFQTLISGQYQGPQSLQNAEQLQNQAQNVGQMGQALNTSGGRIGLLNQTVGNPQYSRGQQTLDNLLLGQSNDPVLQAAKRRALTLQGKVGTAIGGAGQQAQQSVNQAQEFGQNIQNQLGENITSQYAALQAAAQKAQADRDASNTQTQADLASGNLSSDEANQLGINSGQMRYNIDPSKFINQSTLGATAQNMASPEEYARIQALQKLSGQYSPQAAKDVFGQFQDKTQAGQFKATPGYTADKEGYQSAVNSAKTDYDTKLNKAQSGVNDSLQMQRLFLGRFTPEDTAEAKRMGIDVHNLMQAKYSGALHGDPAQAFAWLTQNRINNENNLNQTKTALHNQYGNNQYNVAQPVAQPLVQPDTSNIQDLGLEKPMKIR